MQAFDQQRTGDTVMSDEKISYPFGDMSSTSQSLHSFLDGQWQQHTALFMNQPASYHHLLTGIASVFARVAGNAGEVGDAATNYHKQYEKVYSALYDLADQIDKASQHMETTDQGVKRGFE
jgi:uncharacterized protein YukE